MKQAWLIAVVLFVLTSVDSKKAVAVDGPRFCPHCGHQIIPNRTFGGGNATNYGNEQEVIKVVQLGAININRSMSVDDRSIRVFNGFFERIRVRRDFQMRQRR